MFPESGCKDQKLPLPGLSGVRGTLTKQSLKDSECLGGFHFQEFTCLMMADGSVDQVVKKDFEFSLPSTKHSRFI